MSISSSVLVGSPALPTTGSPALSTSHAEAESQNNSPRWPNAKEEGVCNGNREEKLLLSEAIGLPFPSSAHRGCSGGARVELGWCCLARSDSCLPQPPGKHSRTRPGHGQELPVNPWWLWSCWDGGTVTLLQQCLREGRCSGCGRWIPAGNAWNPEMFGAEGSRGCPASGGVSSHPSKGTE